MKTNLYQKYQGLPAWNVVDEAVSSLVANKDLKEMTARSHIVGYIVKRLVEAGITLTAKDKQNEQ